MEQSIQSLTKSELAQLYFPGAPRSSALRLLHKYITSAHGLLPELERVGYQRASRRLTRRQVMLIFEYLVSLDQLNNPQVHIQPIAFASHEGSIGLGTDADAAAQGILLYAPLATFAVNHSHGLDDDTGIMLFSTFFPYYSVFCLLIS